MKIIAIILIIIAIVYGFYALLMYMEVVAVASLPAILVQGAVMVGITNITWFTLAVIAVAALAIASIVDLDTVKSTLSKVREGIGAAVDSTVGVVTDAAGSVIDGAGNVISSGFKSVGSAVVLCAALFFGWKLVNKKLDEPSKPQLKLENQEKGT